MTPGFLLSTAALRGLGCVAVTDHGSLRGALECQELALKNPALPRVIPGEEIRTTVGEIIGLYLHREIAEGLPPEEAVAAIRAQGGLVMLPHPFDGIRRGVVVPEWREPLALMADVVEVWNGRLLRPADWRRALELAARTGRPFAAGSDAHYPGEVGRSWLEVPRVPRREDLLDLLRAARPGPEPSPRELARRWWFLGRTGVHKSAAALRRRRGPTGSRPGGSG